MERKEKLRLLILGDKTDESADEKIKALVTLAESRFLFILKSAQKRLSLSPLYTTIPDELDWITDEVVIKRFNRLGSEGLTSHSVEGESLNFSTNDFEEFSDDILGFLENEDVLKNKAGRMVFY